MQDDKEFTKSFPSEEQKSPEISSYCAGIANPRRNYIFVKEEAGSGDSADDQPVLVDAPFEELCDSLPPNITASSPMKSPYQLPQQTLWVCNSVRRMIRSTCPLSGKHQRSGQN